MVEFNRVGGAAGISRNQGAAPKDSVAQQDQQPQPLGRYDVYEHALTGNPVLDAVIRKACTHAGTSNPKAQTANQSGLKANGYDPRVLHLGEWDPLSHEYRTTIDLRTTDGKSIPFDGAMLAFIDFLYRREFLREVDQKRYPGIFRAADKKKGLPLCSDWKNDILRAGAQSGREADEISGIGRHLIQGPAFDLATGLVSVTVFMHHPEEKGQLPKIDEKTGRAKMGRDGNPEVDEQTIPASDYFFSFRFPVPKPDQTSWTLTMELYRPEDEKGQRLRDRSRTFRDLHGHVTFRRDSAQATSVTVSGCLNYAFSGRFVDEAVGKRAADKVGGFFGGLAKGIATDNKIRNGLDSNADRLEDFFTRWVDQMVAQIRANGWESTVFTEAEYPEAQHPTLRRGRFWLDLHGKLQVNPVTYKALTGVDFPPTPTVQTKIPPKTDGMN